MADNNQQFEQLYKELETWAKARYKDLGMKDMAFLEKKYALNDYRDSLHYFREVRNLLTHSGKIGDTEARKMLRVTKSMIEEFEQLKENIQEPVINKAVPLEYIYSKSPDDNVLEASKYMKKKSYTHIPIVEDGRVVGLFGEKSLFDIVCSGKIITPDTTFRDIWKYIAIKTADGKKNIKICLFVSPDTIVPDCKQKFTWAIQKNQRLDVVFITDDGTSDGQLLGLTTIWDMPGIDKARID